MAIVDQQQTFPDDREITLDAVLDKIAETLMKSSNMSLDQIISEGRFIVTEPVADAFTKIYRKAREMAKNEVLVELYDQPDIVKSVKKQNQEALERTLEE